MNATARPSVLFKRAKREFGTTRDPMEAGWILPDGSMLDFSEKREGGPPGQRTLDHRAVQRVFPRKDLDAFERGYAPQYQAMHSFCVKGAIRLSVMNDVASIDACKVPTAAQKRTLRDAMEYSSEAVVDIDCNGTKSNEWGPGADRFSPSSVINWTERATKKYCKRKKR